MPDTEPAKLLWLDSVKTALDQACRSQTIGLGDDALDKMTEAFVKELYRTGFRITHAMHSALDGDPKDLKDLYR